MTDDPTDRLQKVMAAAGIASRRASEDLIEQGRVRVDGDVATLGDKVDPSVAVITVDGERINVDIDMTYLAYNKPRGVVTTADDPHGRPTVLDDVDLPQRLFPVGRLDMDTEGLLLLTNDGELTNKLLHPSYEVERTYLALVKGSVRGHVLAELRDGMQLEDGFARPKRARVLEDQNERSLLEIVMTEGRNREVRRMVDAVGLTLDRLARTAYGGIEIGDLKQGRWRHLSHTEVSTLYAAVGEGRRPPEERKVELRERRARQQGHRKGGR